MLWERVNPAKGGGYCSVEWMLLNNGFTFVGHAEWILLVRLDGLGFAAVGVLQIMMNERISDHKQLILRAIRSSLY